MCDVLQSHLFESSGLLTKVSTSPHIEFAAVARRTEFLKLRGGTRAYTKNQGRRNMDVRKASKWCFLSRKIQTLRDQVPYARGDNKFSNIIATTTTTNNNNNSSGGKVTVL